MKKPFVPVLVAGLLGICAMLFAGVKTEYSHHTDFAKYKNYSWIKVQASNPVWADRIRNDVSQVLESRGWKKVPQGGGASISAFRSTKEVRTLNTYDTNLGGGWLWVGFGRPFTGRETPVGTLVVDIFDTPSKKLIWRSVATNTLTGSPGKDEEKLANTVDEMFRNFPPRAKG